MSAGADEIRRLAERLARRAERPEQQDRRDAWSRLNDLRPERPMLWITEIPWEEFQDRVPDLKPVSSDPFEQTVERTLRRALFMDERLPCDEVIEPVWWLPFEIRGADWGVEIREETRPQGASHILSHHFQPAIATETDVEKIRHPELWHDTEATQARRAVLESLFEGVLEVRTHGPRRHMFKGWDQLVRWTGVTEALTALIDRPGFLHALMRRITDVTLMRMDQYERQGLLGYPHPVSRVGSGGAGYTSELPRPGHDPAHIRTRDQWGGATAQIFGGVSPAMHAEFALAYEIEVMDRCGLNYYGCCEPLHHKMDLMAHIPRLRKISISPWCDVAKAAAEARRNGRTYVFSHKPNPACFAGDRMDLAQAEKDLRQRLAASAGLPCEIIMKDISTVRGDVTRLEAWCGMAWRVVNDTSG